MGGDLTLGFHSKTLYESTRSFPKSHTPSKNVNADGAAYNLLQILVLNEEQGSERS